MSFSNYHVKKIKKLFLSILLTFIVVLALAPVKKVFAAEIVAEGNVVNNYFFIIDYDGNIIDYYNPGDEGLKWKLDAEGCFTVSGKGDMNDWINDYYQKYYKSHRSGSYSSTSWDDYNDQIKTVIIEEGVTGIGSGSFKDCKNLTSVILPDSLTRIGELAFSGCENLASINFPEHLTSIGAWAFEECANLDSAEFSDNLLSIGDCAFYGCKKLKKISIPTNLLNMGEEVFYNCNPLVDDNVKDLKRVIIPLESTNVNHHEYFYEQENCASLRHSYLYSKGDNLVRVEQVGLKYIVEEYSNEYKLISSQVIMPDNTNDVDYKNAALGGGFFHGEKYNFIINGFSNPDDESAKNIFQITKYDNNWNRLGDCCFESEQLSFPFTGGTLCSAESNGVLYIHACFSYSTGMNRECVSFIVDEESMEIVEENIPHSFAESYNQLIIVDAERRVVTVDDNNTTSSFRLERIPSEGGANLNPVICDIEKIPAESYYSYYSSSGACLGGLVETDQKYVVAYNYTGGGELGDDYPRNIYLAFVDKKSPGESSKLIYKRKQITSNNEEEPYSVGNPLIVPFGANKGYVLWSEKELKTGWYDEYEFTGKVSYISYSEDGSVSPIKTVEAQLSDCQPLVKGDKIVWYVTDHSAPTFYELDNNGIHKHVIGSCFSMEDLSIDAYYFKPVAWAIGQEITKGTSDTTFSPSDHCTRGQAVTFLWRANGSEKVMGVQNPFKDIKKSDYYYDAVLWALKNGVTNGITDTVFGPNEKCTRGQIVTFLWRSKGKPKGSASVLFKDVDYKAFYYLPVQWAVEKNVTKGTSNQYFSPDDICSRGQIVTFLYRALNE